MAEAFNIAVCPHFLMELHVGLCAAIPNARWVEYIPQLDESTTERMTIRDGKDRLPTSPRLGIAWVAISHGGTDPGFLRDAATEAQVSTPTRHAQGTRRHRVATVRRISTARCPRGGVVTFQSATEDGLPARHGARRRLPGFLPPTWPSVDGPSSNDGATHGRSERQDRLHHGRGAGHRAAPRCKAFVKAGAKVIATDINADKLKELDGIAGRHDARAQRARHRGGQRGRRRDRPDRRAVQLRRRGPHRHGARDAATRISSSPSTSTSGPRCAPSRRSCRRCWSAATAPSSTCRRSRPR